MLKTNFKIHKDNQMTNSEQNIFSYIKVPFRIKLCSYYTDLIELCLQNKKNRTLYLANVTQYLTYKFWRGIKIPIFTIVLKNYNFQPKSCLNSFNKMKNVHCFNFFLIEIIVLLIKHVYHILSWLEAGGFSCLAKLKELPQNLANLFSNVFTCFIIIYV